MIIENQDSREQIKKDKRDFYIFRYGSMWVNRRKIHQREKGYFNDKFENRL